MAQNFTDADAQALSNRLKEFAKTLPDGEKQALRALLMKASSQGQEVQGFEWVDVYEWFPYYGWVYEGTYWD